MPGHETFCKHLRWVHFASAFKTCQSFKTASPTTIRVTNPLLPEKSFLRSHVSSYKSYHLMNYKVFFCFLHLLSFVVATENPSARPRVMAANLCNVTRKVYRPISQKYGWRKRGVMKKVSFGFMFRVNFLVLCKKKSERMWKGYNSSVLDQLFGRRYKTLHFLSAWLAYCPWWFVFSFLAFCVFEPVGPF